mmetsp:Transcript_714/g.1652  ORF Transcript_714/g.1652 Transcript_714/m.1652 type:complete len:221 (-) Transcript_714:825-1487(-)
MSCLPDTAMSRMAVRWHRRTAKAKGTGSTLITGSWIGSSLTRPKSSAPASLKTCATLRSGQPPLPSLAMAKTAMITTMTLPRRNDIVSDWMSSPQSPYPRRPRSCVARMSMVDAWLSWTIWSWMAPQGAIPRSTARRHGRWRAFTWMRCAGSCRKWVVAVTAWPRRRVLGQRVKGAWHYIKILTCGSYRMCPPRATMTWTTAAMREVRRTRWPTSPPRSP